MERNDNQTIDYKKLNSVKKISMVSTLSLPMSKYQFSVLYYIHRLQFNNPVLIKTQYK